MAELPKDDVFGVPGLFYPRKKEVIIIEIDVPFDHLIKSDIIGQRKRNIHINKQEVKERI
jgi:hypothetical protein